MTSARLQMIEEIFHSARELNPASRHKFVHETCGADEQLCNEVEALLAAHESAADFINNPPTRLAAELLATQPIESMTGRSIGHYQLIGKIGSGGMGEVYLARDDRSDRKAAVKILPAHFAGDAVRFRRFEQEARAVVALNHPNILTVYEVGNEDGTQYIASELIEGETLRQRLAGGPMPLEEIVDLGLQVSSALGAAHKAGIVHRDIKPENVMLRPDGYAKVLDFGVAKLAEQELPALIPKDQALLLVQTTFSSILGTLRYMSPEQARGEPVDTRTDIWSFGVVLYEMVTGSNPFSGTQAREVIASVLTTDPPPMTNLRAEVSSELQQLVERALEKDRSVRYSTISEMQEELREIRRKLDFARELAATGGNRISSRRRKRLLVSGAMLVALVSTGVIFLARQRAPTPTAAPAKSIAVLPFENLSADPQNDYFASGIQDEILTKLVGVDGLRVISRASTAKYRSRPEDLKRVANELGVSAVLEGSVQQAGETAHVNVQLIDGLTGDHVWARTFDRDIKNVFAVENEVAEQVASSLKLRLRPSATAEAQTPPTKDPEAYDLYLRGNYAHLQWFRGAGDPEEAVRLMHAAVARDPSFAKAYARLAIYETQKFGQGIGMTRELANDARSNAEKAMALAPDLPESIVAKGLVYLRLDRDYPKSLAYLQRAEAKQPGLEGYLILLSIAEGRLGHWDKSVEDMRRAVELNPRSAHAFEVLGNYYGQTGQYGLALNAYDRGLDLDANNWSIITAKAESLLAQGQLQEARDLLEKMPREIGRTINTAAAAQTRWKCAYFAHDFSGALSVATEMPDSPPDSLGAGEKELLQARTELALEERNKAMPLFDESRRKAKAVLAAGMEIPVLYERLARIETASGNKALALAAADQAIKLAPLNRDADEGLNALETKAEVNSQFGETAASISSIRQLLETEGSGLLITPALLLLDPIWDPLRNDPRFQKLAASRPSK